VSSGVRDPLRAATWRRAVSISTAVGLYGVSVGALSVAAGLSVAQACTLSALMFTGGSQFAYAGVVAAGGSGVAAAASAALLGVRNAFYGLSLVRLLAPPTSGRRAAAAHLTIDESTAVATGVLATDPDRHDVARFGFWATGVGVFLFWNLATLCGALVGDALGDPRTYGLDAAAAAAFLALLWPRLRSARPLGVAAGSGLLALGAVPVVPAGVPVLAAVLVALVAGWPSPSGGTS
jgi:predicted branched-subunit amino acid permease